jgi:catechol 2,3-dioxygenase-like lactoylglutathione lyase family enzyme
MPALKVTDLERSIAWYTEVLGFHAGDRMAGGTREFGIRDPDGYVLAFAEESPPSGT